MENINVLCPHQSNPFPHLDIFFAEPFYSDTLPDKGDIVFKTLPPSIDKKLSIIHDG
jgi:hypothetical protein